MPRITRATRAQIGHKAEEQGSDGYSDSDCDSVVEPRAHAGAATTQSRDAYDATEQTRAQGSAALDAVTKLPAEYPGWMLERQGGYAREELPGRRVGVFCTRDDTVVPPSNKRASADSHAGCRAASAPVSRQ